MYHMGTFIKSLSKNLKKTPTGKKTTTNMSLTDG